MVSETSSSAEERLVIRTGGAAPERDLHCGGDASCAAALDSPYRASSRLLVLVKHQPLNAEDKIRNNIILKVNFEFPKINTTITWEVKPMHERTNVERPLTHRLSGVAYFLKASVLSEPALSYGNMGIYHGSPVLASFTGFDRVCRFNSKPVFSITRNQIDGRISVRQIQPAGLVQPADPVNFQNTGFNGSSWRECSFGEKEVENGLKKVMEDQEMSKRLKKLRD
ncbi:hypothetical protein YC2023_030609 [Brassica napus]